MNTIDKKQLNEWKLSTIGKLFMSAMGGYLAGRAVHTKIRGTKAEIDALTKALMSSKKFQDELRRPGATAESVIQKLGLKNASAAEFQARTGVPWPL